MTNNTLAKTPFEESDETKPTDEVLGMDELVSREDWQNYLASIKGIGEAALSNIQDPATIESVSPSRAVVALKKALRTDYSLNREDATIKLWRHIIGVQDKYPIISPEELLSDRVVKEYLLSRRSQINEHHGYLTENWPWVRNMVRTGINEGIKKGYLPKELKLHLEDAFNKTSIRLVDSELVRLVAPTAAAFYDTNDEITIGHEDGDEKIDYLVHELIHKLAGGTFIKMGQEKKQRVRSGFVDSYSNDQLVKRGFNEAVTEHMASSIIGGNFDIVDPDKRDGDIGIYYKERKLLAAVIDKSRGLINIKDITLAYFEDSDHTGADRDRENFMNLVSACEKAYGSGALDMINVLFSKLKHTSEEELAYEFLSRIHPPIYDRQGKIIAKGYISLKKINKVT